MKITSSSRLYKFAMQTRSEKEGPIETGCDLILHAFGSSLLVLALYITAPLLLVAFVGVLTAITLHVPMHGTFVADFLIVMPFGVATSIAISAVFSIIWWITSRLCKTIEIEIEPTRKPASET